jgi:hypothetical protein
MEDQSPLGRTVQLRSVLDRLLNDDAKIARMRRSILSRIPRFVCKIFRKRRHIAGHRQLIETGTDVAGDSALWVIRARSRSASLRAGSRPA